MKEACYWPTEVSFFEWGSIYNTPEIVVDGQTITQSQYVDFVVADYWSYVTPWGDLTPANCSAASIQLNYGDEFYGYKRALEQGYGWIMWFAFDPSGTGGINNNRVHSMTQFEKTATTLYGKSMAQPQYVYNKLGEGKYDPTPHPIN
jgi:hypothetical protein